VKTDLIVVGSRFQEVEDCFLQIIELVESLESNEDETRSRLRIELGLAGNHLIEFISFFVSFFSIVSFFIFIFSQ